MKCAAKIRLWALSDRAPALPQAIGLPPIKSRKFNSYAEMNAWKKQLLREIAVRGGVQRTR